jgi:HEPN domain-containing protein
MPPPELLAVRQWLEKALHDLQMAEVGLGHSPPIFDAAAFHCQQAVEKLLEAYLTFAGAEFERIHDVETLANRCASHRPEFTVLVPRVAPLTAYAVRFRYPGPADPTLQQVQAALSVAREVWEFVLARLPADALPPVS